MLWRHLASFFSQALRFLQGRPREAQFSIIPIALAPFFVVASCVGSPDVPEEQSVKTKSALIAPPAGPSGSNPGEDNRLGRDFLSDSDAESFSYEASQVPQSAANNPESKELEAKAKTTDSEMIDYEGGAGSIHDQELGEIERELGLEPEFEPYRKRPSLSLGLQSVKKQFKKRNFDKAILEVNSLLEFYPRSPQLLMMKGTLHQWLGQIDLALASFEQAQFFRPNPKLHAQIKYLRLKVKEREQLRGKVKGDVIPGGVERMEVDVLGFEGDEESSSLGDGP